MDGWIQSRSGIQVERYLRGLGKAIRGSLVLSALMDRQSRRRDGEGNGSERQVETDHIGG